MILSDYFTLLFSLVVTVSTVLYVIYTYRLVIETRLMRKMQVAPQIIAYLSSTETHSKIIYLQTKNIGQGVALNVRFKIIKEFQHGFRKLSGYSYFTDGVNYFPPGKQDKHLIMTFGDEHDDERRNDSIILDVEYESVLKEKKVDRFELRIQEIVGEGNLNPPGTYIGMISYRLEKIEKIFDKFQRVVENKLNDDKREL